MRGHDRPQATMLTLVNPEKRVPANHPIRLIKSLVEIALKELSPLFEQMYSEGGRPSIPPERLFRALLLQVFYSLRSERLLMEQLNYNLLFRWFVGLEIDGAVWHHAVFSKNRDRLLNQELAQSFFCASEGASGGADVGRTLYGRRHLDRGLGRAEELPPQRR